ncbi:hypothetical protein BJY17_001378 [Agromyces hippuratus]|uniref:Uncharacterized protein n=1 Tax=Agromyces hippuratus TaxID=286438 RepID=A0A852X3J9_9MICO|nr:hypothetical protein [Agromyces hippuratus]NYG20631.1 hypothetical protein [Agromyces hippuratus]
MTAIRIETDDATLAEMFDWAARTASRFVVGDGRRGPLDVSEADPGPYRTGEYRASYHAGYLFRSGYYLRDFAHQAVGAQLLGLARHNAAMLESFVRSATPEHGGWPVWALNFDRVTPLAIDYRGPDRFVRELPAVFELVELVHVLYRWTGDRSLLEHQRFWRRTMTDFVAAHDRSFPNGVAEADGPGIFDGAASYNERPAGPLLEAGDAFAAQYAANRHAARLESALGEDEASDRFASAADRLAAVFAADWGAADGATGRLVSARDADGLPLREWMKEATWFPPMKGLVDGDHPARSAVLDRIDRASRALETRPRNVEALSYLPELFLRHGRPDTAFEWMRTVYDARDAPHEVAAQGPNGDYPEVSFTLVAQIVAGFLGLEPDAPTRTVTTRPALPRGIARLAAHDIPFGGGAISIGIHLGHELWLENGTSRDLDWVPFVARDDRFHDPHLGEASFGDAHRVAPGERRTIRLGPDGGRGIRPARARSTAAASAQGR